MKNFRSAFSKIVKLSLIIFVVFFFENGSKQQELKIENTNLNRTLDLTSMAEKVKEENVNNLYYALDTFVGDLTGYAADCPLCGGTLGCAPSYEILNSRKTTYPDVDYGEVRIVAASKSTPCGSIVRINNSKLSDGPLYAIVLDRGVSGKQLDILMASEAEALSQVGRSTVTYDILRFGWER